MNKRQLKVKVSSLEESLARFKNVWEKVEGGKKLKTPIEILSFENPVMLMKILSAKRLELLQELHMLGRVSIRQLAKKLERDYSNVHQDIQALYQNELILKDKTGKYYVPWESIVTEIPLTLSKNNGLNHQQHSRTALTHFHH